MSDDALITKAYARGKDGQADIDEAYRHYQHMCDSREVFSLAGMILEVADYSGYSDTIGFTISRSRDLTEDGHICWELKHPVTISPDDIGQPVIALDPSIVEEITCAQFFDIDDVARPLMRYVPNQPGFHRSKPLNHSFNNMYNDPAFMVYLGVEECRHWLQLMLGND